MKIFIIACLARTKQRRARGASIRRLASARRPWVFKARESIVIAAQHKAKNAGPGGRNNFALTSYVRRATLEMEGVNN